MLTRVERDFTTKLEKLFSTVGTIRIRTRSNQLSQHREFKHKKNTQSLRELAGMKESLLGSVLAMKGELSTMCNILIRQQSTPIKDTITTEWEQAEIWGQHFKEILNTSDVGELSYSPPSDVIDTSRSTKEAVKTRNWHYIN